ncbi:MULTISPECIES: hypothetical protein [unclassified Pseudomonas]|uniref:hypothetical protein n=1 Tax=unclassified Pseudomonas TaxID=196821 RepID=UPI000D34C347|nr:MULTISPECIES: hypothetical protein [unclassified Pseudomonas]RAU43469.1 hypothetical protein DBP26_019925 [Pseudomonas sp. RIT 409]RAU49994.1 hypothetical protein DBY65_022860 [Pseudomonas sp. RIT 412]
MFVPLEGPEYPTNSFRYGERLVRFTYRVDTQTSAVGGVDIDAKLQNGEGEERIYTLRGNWPSKEEALKAAQDWTAKYFNRS